MWKHPVIGHFMYLCLMTKLPPTQLNRASVVSSAYLYRNVNIHKLIRI